MKHIFALILLVGNAFGITNVTLPYIVDTASIPKIRYVDKNDSALKWGINNLGDTVNAATGSGTLVRSASPTMTGALTLPKIIVTDSARIPRISSALILAQTLNGTKGFFSDSVSVSGRFAATDSSINLGDNVTRGTVLTIAGKTGSTNPYVFSTASTAGQLDITVNSASNRTVGFTNTGAGTLGLVVEGGLTVGTAATFTAAPVFSSVTASQILSVDGSKNLTSTATTGTGSVMLAASPTTTGTLTAAAISASGTVTADSIISRKFYQDTSFTVTLTGCTTSPTATAYVSRIGKIVHLTIPSLSATSNATTLTMTGLPSIFAAAHTQDFPIVLTNASAQVFDEGTQVEMGAASSVIRFLRNESSSGFTNSATTKGVFWPTTITYTLQ